MSAMWNCWMAIWKLEYVGISCHGKYRISMVCFENIRSDWPGYGIRHQTCLAGNLRTKWRFSWGNLPKSGIWDILAATPREGCLKVFSGWWFHDTYIQYITLHYITFHYITLHYIPFHCIALHYITLHYITYITYITNIYIYTCFFHLCTLSASFLALLHILVGPTLEMPLTPRLFFNIQYPLLRFVICSASLTIPHQAWMEITWRSPGKPVVDQN